MNDTGNQHIGDRIHQKGIGKEMIIEHSKADRKQTAVDIIKFTNGHHHRTKA